MRSVLIVADMEGIGGVDSLEALASGTGQYLEAARLMSKEVGLVAGLLRQRGVQTIRVVDSHRSGAPWNIDPNVLPEGAAFLVPDDSYERGVFTGVDAVVCIGMHAAGGTNGFAAHTVSTNPLWRIDGQAISETQIVEWLAAEQGVPFWFSSGDDVLERSTGAHRFVLTKRSEGVEHTRSEAPEIIEARYRAMVSTVPGAIVQAPTGAIELCFHMLAQTNDAVAQGLQRHSAQSVLVHGATFRERYERAHAVVNRVEEEDAESVSAMFTRWAR